MTFDLQLEAVRLESAIAQRTEAARALGLRSDCPEADKIYAMMKRLDLLRELLPETTARRH